jgi:hypothetical protein
VLLFRRSCNIFAQMFVFVVLGFSRCKSLYFNEREKCYGRQIYAFNPHEGTGMGHSYVVISDNTLQEILSNPHEFVLEFRVVVYFGR